MNTTMSPAWEEPVPFSIRDMFILILYLITAIIAMVGNVFVCLTIYRKKRLHSTTYVLIFNMALSDILGGFVIPAQWLFCSTALLETGSFCQSMCGLMKTLQILSYYVSSLTMTAIAYDRYRLVCHPMGKRVNVTCLVVLVWALGIIFISQNFVLLRVSEYFSPTKGLITCRIVWMYQNVSIVFRRTRSLFLMISQYFIPLGLTLLFYGLVMHRIWFRQQVGSNDDTKKQEFEKKKRQTIQMLIFVTTLFALSYLPTHIWHFILFYTNLIPQKKNTCYSSTFYMISYWIGISSCAYNPFIYIYFNSSFQKEALRYWTIVSSCGQASTAESDESGLGVSSQTDSTADSKLAEKAGGRRQSEDKNHHNCQKSKQKTTQI